MKLAIMQPYFFPYLGYFRLIHRADRWLVFDTAQYIRRGWVNRNRVLKPSRGWCYIYVPVSKAPRETAIADVAIRGEEWQERLMQQLTHYRNEAPHYRKTLKLVERCLAANAISLSKLNVGILAHVCNTIGITFEPEYLSTASVDPGSGSNVSDRIISIVTALGATTYCNPSGGAHLYNPAKFKQAGIGLEISPYEPLSYSTGSYNFEPGLSIIDTLMWLSPSQIHDSL